MNLQVDRLPVTHWSFTIHRPTPLLNETRAMHWRELRRLKRDWFYLIRAVSGHVPKATGPRRVLITRYSSGTPDQTNLEGGIKEVLEDNLRRPKRESGIYKTGARKGQTWVKDWIGLGLLVEDSPAWLERRIQSVKCKRNEARTVVHIYDLTLMKCQECGHQQLVYDEGCGMCCAHAWGGLADVALA